MIGIVLVTHGRLAQEFIATLEQILGRQHNLLSVGLFPSDDIEAKRKEIEQAIQQADERKGVVIVTDMFGGTPSNLAHSLLEKYEVEIIAGMNLPLLIKLVSARNTKSLREAVFLAQETGQKYIQVSSHILKEKLARAS